MSYEEDDESLFNTRRNLTSIFNSDLTDSETSSNVVEQKKIGGRPNKNMSSSGASETQSQSAVIIVKVVQCFVYENNIYKSQGKVGAAIVRGDSALDYSLILYKDKTKPMTKAQITAKFWFNLQPSSSDSSNHNNYATFYDMRNVLWSILFDSSTDLISFSIEVALARWLSKETHTSIISQDLLIVKADEKVNEGDQVNVTFISWPFQSPITLDKTGEERGTLSMTLSYEKKWENALIGMEDGGKRALIIPALLLDEWPETIGRECSKGLFLQVTVKKCPPIKAPQAGNLVLPRLPSFGDEKGSDRSSSRAKREENFKSKQDLILRLGKLGKPMSPTSSSRRKAVDSDETEEDSSSAVSEPTKPLKPRREVHKLKSKPSNQTIVPKSSGLQENQVMIIPAVNHPMMATLNSIPFSPIDPQISEFITDQRSHNTEIRLGLSSAANKLDDLIEKTSTRSIEKVIDQIQKIEENMLLNLSLINCKNSDLDNTHLGNKTTVLKEREEKRGDEDLEKLTSDNERIRGLINEQYTVINDLKSQIDDLTSCKQELENKLLSEKAATKELEEEKILAIKNLDSLLNNPYKFVHDIESSMEMWTSKVNALERTLDKIVDGNQEEKSDRKEILSESDQVMEEMNSLYKVLKSKFEDGDNNKISAAQVNNILDEFFKDIILESDHSTAKENLGFEGSEQLQPQPDFTVDPSSNNQSQVPPPVPYFDEVSSTDSNS